MKAEIKTEVKVKRHWYKCDFCGHKELAEEKPSHCICWCGIMYPVSDKVWEDMKKRILNNLKD